MHVVTRTYAGTEMADFLVQHKSEVEKLIRSAPGFVSYVIAKFDDSTMTATLCESAEGCARTVELAKQWLAENASDMKATPQVKEGEIIFRFLA